MKGDSGEPGLQGPPGEDAFVPIDYIKRKYTILIQGQRNEYFVHVLPGQP